MGESVFITGNSSGIGRTLTDRYLAAGSTVYGLSRRGYGEPISGLHDERCDLAHLDTIAPALERLLRGVTRLDLVILNAGVLGEIRDIVETPLRDILWVMDVNVWANKIILDWLHRADVIIPQVVMISSGAAVNGHRGWGSYSLSKATLNMLAKLYAHELTDSHVTALAPGLVDTAMQEYLCDSQKVDARKFASVAKLRNARGTQDMPTPPQAADMVIACLPDLKRHPSGSFLDIRSM